MPEYTARWGAMNNTANNFKGYVITIDRCQNSIRNLSRNLYLNSGATRSVQQRLKVLSNTLENLQKQCGYMGTTLSNVAQTYQDTENEILGKASVNSINTDINTTVKWQTNKPSNTNNADEKLDWKEKIIELVSGAGYIGGIIDGIFNFSNIFKKSGYDRAKSVTDFMKNCLEYITGVRDVISDAKVKWTGIFKNGNWKKIFGFDDLLDTTVKKGAKAAFTENIDDTISELNGTKGKLDCFTKWGGYALSLVSNVIDNKKEYDQGGITKERAVQETFMETVIDIGKDALIGAGVAAACVAAFGSAPAVAVAAGTVAVGWAVDKVTKWATKKFTGKERNFTEFASDTILDFTEKVTSAKSSVAKWFTKPLLSGVW